jgi:hypothetical protein
MEDSEVEPRGSGRCGFVNDVVLGVIGIIGIVVVLWVIRRAGTRGEKETPPEYRGWWNKRL